MAILEKKIWSWKEFSRMPVGKVAQLVAALETIGLLNALNPKVEAGHLLRSC